MEMTNLCIKDVSPNEPEQIYDTEMLKIIYVYTTFNYLSLS